MKKIWRYNNFDINTRKVREGEEYKEPEYYQETNPGPDYTEITDQNLVDLYKSIDVSKTEYEIYDDVRRVVRKKDVRDINYKTELKSDIAYTPIFYIHDVGILSGMIDKTEYYRNYIDDSNKGTLVLQVVEEYIVDDSNTSEYNSAKNVLSRKKKWKYAIKSGGVDNDNIKVRPKKYNTRKKRHKEGNRRRNNIMEQLIDNVGLAGVLSGTFTGPDDAYDSLANMQTTFSAPFSTWLNSGKGSIYTDISNSTVTWLSNTIPDTPTTQAMIPHMIGMSFKNYIVEKLKGNIK